MKVLSYRQKCKKLREERLLKGYLPRCKNPGNNKFDRHIRKKYGITENQYSEIFNLQKGVCYLCGSPETHKYKGTLCKLSVDHNHKTGKVRGLLCNNCNIGLGKFKDNLKVIQKAFTYVLQDGINFQTR